MGSNEKNKQNATDIHCHFFPSRRVFPKDYPSWKVYASTLGGTGTVAVLIFWARARGFSEVLRHYIGPYFVVNCWLVTYTWLHHTHPKVPHYGDGEWTRFKGDKATIDRDYGIFDFFHHNIGSTHVVHHMFAKIPHYHAKEATEIVKKLLGEEYNYSEEHWLKSLYKTAHECVFVDSVHGVQQYRGYEQMFNNQESH